MANYARIAPATSAASRRRPSSMLARGQRATVFLSVRCGQVRDGDEMSVLLTHSLLVSLPRAGLEGYRVQRSIAGSNFCFGERKPRRGGASSGRWQEQLKDVGRQFRALMKSHRTAALALDLMAL
jgi:hypothetical protein